MPPNLFRNAGSVDVPESEAKSKWVGATRQLSQKNKVAKVLGIGVKSPGLKDKWYHVAKYLYVEVFEIIVANVEPRQNSFIGIC